jgi:hypothetical protein
MGEGGEFLREGRGERAQAAFRGQSCNSRRLRINVRNGTLNVLNMRTGVAA